MSENLWDALYFRNLDTINALLDVGEDINFKNNRYSDRTPLHFTIEYGWVELAALLIQRGADVNVADSNGNTPLYFAVQQRNVELVQKLIDAGAIIDRLQRFSPLHKAVFEEHQVIIDLLLDSGASIDFLQNGETAVEYAASFGNQHLVHHLLKRGAKQSLHIAAAMGDIAAIQQHIVLQGDINARMGTIRRYGAPPLLYIAAVNNQLAIAELLIKQGADPNIECCQDDYALLAACQRGFVEMAKLLIEGGADIRRTNMSGGILVNTAAGGSVELVKLVLGEYGISIHSDQGNQGNTPTVAAACHGHLPMLKFLLEQGLSFPDYVFSIVVSKGDREMLQFFLQHGADPNLPLDRLADDGDLAKVELLLSLGADVNAGATTGQETALHRAARRGNLPMVKLLVAAGANVNATDRCGDTPLTNATLWRSDDVIDFLLANGARS